MSLRVVPVKSRRELRVFRDLPARLHARHEAFVPMLDAAFGALFAKRNPFWTRNRSREWLCLRGAEPVGRIGACLDLALFEREGGCGAVGLFECAGDAQAAAALFSEAEAWLAAQGCQKARGPLNYSIHDTAGVLVEGFDTPPTVDTTWNPPYYDGLWTQAAWEGAQDMLGAAGRLEFRGPERARRFAERARKRGLSVRAMDVSCFYEEVELLRKLYNKSWNSNWGHVTVSAEEFAYKAKDLKAVFDPDLVRIAEFEGQAVGFFMGLPDLNVAVKRSGGKLLPFGWWRLLRAKRAARRVRVVALGVVPGYRNRGVEALILSDSFEAIGSRYPWCEASWVLADNAAMVNGLALYGLHPYKRWRMYQKELAAGN